MARWFVIFRYDYLPLIHLFIASADDTLKAGQPIILTEAKVLEIIESAYPNPVTLKDVSK